MRLAAIGVDAAVVPVGVDDRGQMEVPEKVDTVGWYRFGPGPGSDAGSAVLSGHVDDRVQGRGAFYSLTDLDEGDPVRVDLTDGTELDYRVTRVERIDKSVLPTERLFARDGAPHLTLVTCGGEFDYATATTATTSSSRRNRCGDSAVIERQSAHRLRPVRPSTNEPTTLTVNVPHGNPVACRDCTIRSVA